MEENMLIVSFQSPPQTWPSSTSASPVRFVLLYFRRSAFLRRLQICPRPIKDFLSNILKTLEPRNRSEETIKIYRHYLTEFLTALMPATYTRACITFRRKISRVLHKVRER